ncbi:tetrapyrrole biosynthesis, uroporphyrinogen III synthase [Trichoderma reesei RUT C-30]|uniref:Tetrapyrrole biosynthesis, uroporphyrinogen III synthase n=1 Tax=Hypocrea jecorina (strain ATCC 56765 / BCRC 32924 / NRRL 11460 / Rut C-30) TaxID=1344414 RepID=A0A024SEN0_HYPJR|nr:tetrapyrrole biosynthesis, uroporphyrinogen III synthase [Trichoderma reesei RUT C-30]
MSSPTSSDQQPIPVLLLKTKSSPTDAYEDLFSSQSTSKPSFAPTFVPVLQHRFEDTGVNRLRDLLRRKRIGTSPDCDFGGLIFTSQRAVEAFSHVVREDEASKDPSWPHLQHIPIYSVGPATTRALSAVPQDPPLQIFGSQTGNGDALAHFILDHYAQCKQHDDKNNQLLPPLLFLVGEQRRDIIPRTLTDPSLPAHRRIPVTEEVVYGTGEMPSFPEDFSSVLNNNNNNNETRSSSSERWVVVFSPTGCDSMLRGLGLLDPETGNFAAAGGTTTSSTTIRDGRTFVATIGPTTRNYLVHKFGFEPDVCAETPTPEGVLEGILAFRKRRLEKTT